ncbi:hypothetical protein MESS2_760147 [Mesorhizobium metallidurans STM 2683]|uniref:Uncharacterized protein n=1 Tax=Mesorhizobium metallidurans STM 2683 TaxID=1297569 RepID=M5EXB0_9HYPH|nr:hypothetical protein MESS2_760147 [Mesorhizobium metallidurans STM 2683]
MGCAIAIAGSLWRARQRGLVTTYGSSRWAINQEIDRAGLFRPAGVFLGKLKDRYLRHAGPEHVMALRRHVRARASGWVVPTLPGPAQPSFTTLKVRSDS